MATEQDLKTQKSIYYGLLYQKISMKKFLKTHLSQFRFFKTQNVLIELQGMH